MDHQETDTSTAFGPVLATWHCDKMLWRQYVDSERFDAAVRSAILLFIVPIVVTPLILAATFLAYRFADLSSYWTAGLAIVAAVLGGILALVGLILWASRHQRAAAMRTETGDVTIALDGFSINGQRFDWNFGPREILLPVWRLQFKGAVWRFQNCRRKTVAGRMGSSFEVLEFEFEATSRDPKGRTYQQTITDRLPIPSDKISEADAAASRLNLRFESAKREWEGSD
ncbi:MAG TPA: hypothetical protein VNA17_06200 [Pyrinomonadaceae bacterium]|nr:hypothetical protein [Pyrinomonadaceae bacterium]